MAPSPLMGPVARVSQSLFSPPFFIKSYTDQKRVCATKVGCTGEKNNLSTGLSVFYTFSSITHTNQLIMKIRLRRLDDAYHMEARNEAGNTVLSDGAESIGGHGAGMRPMEMFISSLGACSSIDVIHFLKKMRQGLEDISLDIDAERDPDNTPSLFTKVHIAYTLRGQLDEKKVKKAIGLSVDKYCSVARILEKTATITWSYTINPE